MADPVNTVASKISQALGAYGAGSKLGGSSEGTFDFGDMVKDAIKGVADTQKNAEKVQAQALTGKASVTDVVQAVSEAELTLQTFTSIRDRFISAYQDIMRMPV